MSPLRLLAALLLMLSPAVARAHGMDKPGPHGGFIRMPGTFHTEVLDNGAGKFQVYLLDGRFENAVVEGSSVKLSFTPAGGTAVSARCTPEKDSFTCVFEAFPTKGEGDLRIEATREGTVGHAAVYPYPLTLLKHGEH